MIRRKPVERTYTKADVMRALAIVEAPVVDDPEFVKAESESTVLKAFNAGANLMAEAVVDCMGQEEASARKLDAYARIMIDELFKRARDRAGADPRAL